MGHGLDSCGLSFEQVACSGDFGNKPVLSIKCEEFLDYVRKCWLFKYNYFIQLIISWLFNNSISYFAIYVRIVYFFPLFATQLLLVLKSYSFK
jgi:hypothetical protein